MNAKVWFELPPGVSSESAVAIGNFDGVHLGHQALLSAMANYARSHKLTATALTFDPHPSAIVAPERLPEMICSVPERIRLLEKAGAEQVIVLPFTREVSRQTPRQFVGQTLVQGLRAKAVFVGENFRFGHGQAGRMTELAELGREFGFSTSFLAPVVVRGEVVSSSRLRKLIRNAEVDAAGRLLGRCFSVQGEVVAGQQIGSRQTVPTLNLAPVGGLVLPRGVFVTGTQDRATGRHWASITNVGNRPTFAGDAVTIETFLLDPFDGETPRELEVEFRSFVRAEKRFDTPDALKQQIFKDAGRAQAYWRRLRRWQRRTMAGSIY